MLSSYAKPYSGALEKALNEKTVKLDTVEDVKKFAKEVQNGAGDYGINFNNLGNEKNTIEFRISNGTTDIKTWIENINLFGGLVKASEDLAIIQKKMPEERTDEERIKLKLFERLNKDEIDDSERLEILLQIVIPKEDRDVYRNRYRVNSKLYEKSIVKDFIKKKLAKNKINIISKSTKSNIYNKGVNDNHNYIR